MAEILHFGTVRWFNNRQGYGFIVPREGQRDVFFHRSVVDAAGLHELPEGQQVAYALGQVEDGRDAAIELALVA